MFVSLRGQNIPDRTRNTNKLPDRRRAICDQHILSWQAIRKNENNIQGSANDKLKNKNKQAEVRGILCAPRVPSMVKTLLDKCGLEHREIQIELELEDEKQSKLQQFKEE